MQSWIIVEHSLRLGLDLPPTASPARIDTHHRPDRIVAFAVEHPEHYPTAPLPHTVSQ